MRNFSISLLLGMGLTGMGFAASDSDAESKASQSKAKMGTMTAANQMETSETSSAYPEMPTECKAGDSYRKVWIEYGNSEGQKCKVNYIKDQEPAKVLWTAENDPDYCVNKAKGLINETLSGFKCSESQEEAQ